MIQSKTKVISRRRALATLGAGAGLAAAGGFVAPRVSFASQSTVKVGILLPYSGTYARLGDAITNGLKLRVAQDGGKIAGREIEFIELDSEAAPPKAAELTTKLVSGDKVDFLIGPVHSGVAMGMAKIAREEGTMTIVPNAGADQLTGALCSPNLFRTSFTNWQPSYPMGRVMKDRGINNALLCYWNYGAGKQAAQGFKDGFGEVGGEIVKEIGVPFPEVEFQAVLTEIAATKPEAVFVFFAGGGAVKFVKDYAAAGLKEKIPLFGSGFLTEGVTKAQGEAAEGLMTTLHYADTLDNPETRCSAKPMPRQPAAVPTYMPCRAMMPARSWRSGWRRRAATWMQGTRWWPPCPRPPGPRHAGRFPCRSLTIRCRTSICAKSATV